MMADDLAAVVRNLAQEEGIAAELDRPYTPAMRDRYVRDVRRRRTAGVSALALVAVAVVGAGAWGVGRATTELPPVEVVVTEPTPEPTPEPTATRLSTSEPTSSPTAEATPTPTPTPTETAPPAVEPEEQETTPPPPPPPAPPGAVTGVRAAPGGGSGEIMAWWEPVPGATGYRVYRADSPDGPFVAAASIDMSTNAVTIEYGGWHEYIWMLVGVQSATAIEYGEVVAPIGYYRVAAFNAGGEGPRSSVVCGQAPGSGQTC